MTLSPAESYSAAFATGLAERIFAATKRPAVAPDKATGTGDAYTEVHLSRRFTESLRRAGGTRAAVGWRLSTRVVSKSIATGRLMEDRIASCFADWFDLAGEPVLVQHESGGGDFDRDDEGYFHALTDWTFVR